MKDRDRKIMRLRKKGFEISEIAEVMSVSRSVVDGAITRGIQEINDTHTIDAVKAMELVRLESVHKVYYPDAMKGDEDAAKMILQVHDRTAKMFGLHKEVFDANLTVGLIGVLASLSGQPDPTGEGAIEHIAVEDESGSVRARMPWSGTGTLAGRDDDAGSGSQLSFGEEWPRSGEVSSPILADPVVDDVLLSGESGMHSAEQSPDVRRSVVGAGDVASEDAPGFTVRLPVKVG